MYNIQAVLEKNGPRYNFAIDDPNEKIIQQTNGSKNTKNLSKHPIYPFMDNGQLLFFKW
jgi:hypothetical protein